MALVVTPTKGLAQRRKNTQCIFHRIYTWHLSIWPHISIHIGFAHEIYIPKSSIINGWQENEPIQRHGYAPATHALPKLPCHLFRVAEDVLVNKQFVSTAIPQTTAGIADDFSRHLKHLMATNKWQTKPMKNFPADDKSFAVLLKLR